MVAKNKLPKRLQALLSKHERAMFRQMEGLIRRGGWRKYEVARVTIAIRKVAPVEPPTTESLLQETAMAALVRGIEHHFNKKLLNLRPTVMRCVKALERYLEGRGVEMTLQEFLDTTTTGRLMATPGFGKPQLNILNRVLADFGLPRIAEHKYDHPAPE